MKYSNFVVLTMSVLGGEGGGGGGSEARMTKLTAANQKLLALLYPKLGDF